MPLLPSANPIEALNKKRLFRLLYSNPVLARLFEEQFGRMGWGAFKNLDPSAYAGLLTRTLPPRPPQAAMIGGDQYSFGGHPNAPQPFPRQPVVGLPPPQSPPGGSLPFRDFR